MKIIINQQLTKLFTHERHEEYLELRKKQKEYASRYKQDNRWSQFLAELNQRYKVSEQPTDNPDIYEIFDVNIASVNGATYEPNSEGYDSVSMFVYLKEKQSRNTYKWNTLLTNRLLKGK